MNINKHNYEAFFIDYLDGNLSGNNLSDFLTFLENNPLLKKELEEFESCKLRIHDASYPDKNALKRTLADIPEITEKNFDEFCIAQFEGDLDDYQEIKVQEYLIKNPNKQIVYTLYSKTFIEPDLTIKFNKKALLKKLSIAQKHKRLLYMAASIAAVFALIVTLLYYYNNNKIVNKQHPAANVTTINPRLSNVKQIPDPDLKISTITIDNKIEDDVNQTNNLIASSTNDMKASDTSKNSNTSYSFLVQKADPVEINKIESYGHLDQNVYNTNYTLIAENTNFPEEEYISLKDIALHEIKSFIYKDELEDTKRFSFWDIAEASVHSINKISDYDIQLDKKTDEYGNVRALAINSPGFGFSTTRLGK